LPNCPNGKGIGFKGSFKMGKWFVKIIFWVGQGNSTVWEELRKLKVCPRRVKPRKLIVWPNLS